MARRATGVVVVVVVVVLLLLLLLVDVVVAGPQAYLGMLLPLVMMGRKSSEGQDEGRHTCAVRMPAFFFPAHQIWAYLCRESIDCNRRSRGSRGRCCIGCDAAGGGGR